MLIKKESMLKQLFKGKTATKIFIAAYIQSTKLDWLSKLGYIHTAY